MFDNLKKISQLKADLKLANENLTQAREDRDKAELKLLRVRTDHTVDMDDLITGNQITNSRLINENEVLEKSIPLKVAKEVAQEKKDLRIRSEKHDREHVDRMKKLEAEHAAKIAKADRDLETDKVSYRKYLKQEFNTRIETLEKANLKLSEEASTLRAENSSLVGSNESLEVVNESLTDSVSELSKGMVALSGKIADGLVKAVPTITADFETPVLPENHVHVEVPGAAKGGQGGGNQDKKS